LMSGVYPVEANTFSRVSTLARYGFRPPSKLSPQRFFGPFVNRFELTRLKGLIGRTREYWCFLFLFWNFLNHSREHRLRLKRNLIS
jgi:hypothetical protein